jgi:ribulose 1,5-bisphosphate synthetase/thiazole synthase
MSVKHDDTTPYWSSATFPPFVKLAEDVVADLVIVGGGVTGLSAAYLLAKAGKRVGAPPGRIGNYVANT